MRQWLKIARESAGFTQQRLGDMVGKNITTIGKYENGQRRPSVSTAKKIAEVLNFDWQLFYPDEESNVQMKGAHYEARQAAIKRAEDVT